MGDRIRSPSFLKIFVELASPNGVEQSYLNGAPSAVVFDDTLGISVAKSGVQMLMAI